MSAFSPGSESRGAHAVPRRDRRWRAGRLRASRLYLCTDLQRFLRSPGDTAVADAGSDTVLDHGALEAFYRACFRGGVDIIQVRDKAAPLQLEIAALQLLVRLAREHEALAAANDRADIALLTDVDVFHAGQTDLGSGQARAVLGPDVLLGRSCHTPDQVRTAADDPEIDYFCTGPVWATPTKPGRAPVGLELPAFAASLHREAGARATPFFAIGGIDGENLPHVRAAGAERIVVVRAISEAQDPGSAARALRSALPY